MSEFLIVLGYIEEKMLCTILIFQNIRVWQLIFIREVALSVYQSICPKFLKITNHPYDPMTPRPSHVNPMYITKPISILHARDQKKC